MNDRFALSPESDRTIYSITWISHEEQNFRHIYIYTYTYICMRVYEGEVKSCEPENERLRFSVKIPLYFATYIFPLNTLDPLLLKIVYSFPEVTFCWKTENIPQAASQHLHRMRSAF